MQSTEAHQTGPWLTLLPIFHSFLCSFFSKHTALSLKHLPLYVFCLSVCLRLCVCFNHMERGKLSFSLFLYKTQDRNCSTKNQVSMSHDNMRERQQILWKALPWESPMCLRECAYRMDSGRRCLPPTGNQICHHLSAHHSWQWGKWPRRLLGDRAGHMPRL